MLLLKNRLILIFLIISPITLSSLMVAAVGFNKSSTVEAFKEENSVYYNELDVQSIASVDTFSQVFPIFGYRKNFVDLTLKLKWNDFEFKNVPIYGVLYINRNETKDFYYHIENPLYGFFMTIVIAAEMTYIDIAFDDGDSQYCYNGLTSKGYTVFDPYFNQLIEIVHLNIERNTKVDNLENMIQSLKAFQCSSIGFYQSNKEDEFENTRTITFTQYGVAHECADFSTVNLAEDLPDDYWEPYSEIDYGIYRRTPTEAQVKSDLQYYNKDYIPQYVRDIKAYAVYAHSNSASNTDWLIREWWVWDWWPFIGHYVREWLTPSEVSSLWYYIYNGYETRVYPTDMIIHATVCYGYSGSDGIPHMAKAFVDYEAAAYIGATVGIPGLHNDEFTGDFWYDLCQSDKTVYQATQSYISTHNYYDDYPTIPENLNIDWDYGTHIKIYGSTSVKLDN
ncbi:MAG: hypothetical protein P8Y97_14930 [Candidatus Lokiarchaeota archaeon]